MRLSPIHHLPPIASGAMERIQSYQEIDQTGLGSLLLFSPLKGHYEVTGIGLLLMLPLQSPCLISERFPFTVLKDQIFLQHPGINDAKKQELFESC